jgi:hypothetical protein
MTKDTKMRFPTSFGVFSPTGHVVMVFPTGSDAERARQLLFNNGFAQEDVTHYNQDEVMAELEKSEKQSESWQNKAADFLFSILPRTKRQNALLLS